MYVIGWMVVGLIEGFVAARLAEDEGRGFVVDMVLGAAGAVAGGLMFSSFSAGPIVLSLPSMMVALAGAVVVLAAYHALVSRR